MTGIETYRGHPISYATAEETGAPSDGYFVRDCGPYETKEAARCFIDNCILDNLLDDEVAA